MPLIVIGMSHRTSPVELRERFAFAEESIPEVLSTLRTTGLAEEAVILSTCNRVELYAGTVSDDNASCVALRQFLLESRQFAGAVTDEIYVLREPQSLEHLFRVASGLESMALGETEILGQLKKAYDFALRHRHTGGCLNKAFQRAFNVAKHVRTETNIQRGSISIASVAVELAEKIFSSLGDHTVMVLGAGDTSEKTARALLSRGVRKVLVSNRSHDRAVALADVLGGRAVRFDDWAADFAGIDIIISSTSAPHYVIDRAKLQPLAKLRGSKSLLLIDIAVPRDIEPEVNFLENVYLYNIDDLQGIADGYLKQRQDEISRCESIIREKVQGLRSSAVPRPLTPEQALVRADI
jgi:glutamyl-tRNA reductase